eukprot:symbB.v1.2.041809.t1/scaffold8669.1/size8008/1
MGLHGRAAFQANIFIVGMVFLGDTRSAKELAVFTNMAPERLCLECRLRVDEKFTSIFSSERGPLFAASVKYSNLTCVSLAHRLLQRSLQKKKMPYGKPFSHWKIGAAAAMIAGFLVIDSTLKVIVASTDIGEVVDWITDKFLVHNKGNLAVLYNRNKMVNTFTNTEWVSDSGGAIISRSVTSCAGMTAFLVLLAQTRVDFLSGGREKSFHQLPAQERASQKEEAYARATVALTRAQQICFIMGPLDMQGLVGAATIIGCLKYGASFSGLDEQKDSVFLIRLKDDNLLESPDDSAFLQSLQFFCARVNGVYPPLALVEAYITEEDSAPKVRRQHLIVVDLH